ncbi:MAG TPA: Ig-like domain-containing protein [Planctomycetota bacterium]|nr:Ig-like domain-containing protein [Planctomycetota bacterium]
MKHKAQRNTMPARAMLLAAAVAIILSAALPGPSAYGATAVAGWAPVDKDITPDRLQIEDDIVVAAGEAYVNFNYPIFPRSVTSDSIYVQLKNGARVPAEVVRAHPDHVTAYRIDLLDALKANSEYIVYVTTDVKDINQESVEAQNWPFYTPNVTPNGQSVAVTARIDIDFGDTQAMWEDSLAGTQNVIVTNSASAIVSGTVIKNPAPAGVGTYIFVPDSDLAHSTEYTVVILGGVVQDASYNPLFADIVCIFKTVDLTVVSIDPADGTTGVDPDKTATKVTATFSDRVNPSTVTAGTFHVTSPGGTAPGTVALVPGTGERTYTYTFTNDLDASTQYTVTLTNGIKDYAGGALLAKSTTFTTAGLEVVDFETQADPMPVNGWFKITFSEAVDQSTVTADSFKVENQRDSSLATGGITWNGAGDELTFTPTQPMLKADTYRVIMTSDIKGSASGLGLAPHIPLTFQTEPLSLKVDSVDPPDDDDLLDDVGLVSPSIGEIRIAFNESVEPDTVTGDTFGLSLRLSDTVAKAVDGTVQPVAGTDDKVFVFIPSSPLLRGAIYDVQVTGARDSVTGAATGITDAYGNAMMEDFSSAFATSVTGGEYTLRGFVTRYDRNFNPATGAESPNHYVPIRAATVNFVPEAGGDPVGFATTDSSGYYEVNFHLANPGRIRIRVDAEGTLIRQTLSVRKPSTAAAYSWEHPDVVDVGAAAVQDIEISGADAPAFNIYDTLMAAYEKVLSLNPADLGAFVLTAYWEAGSNGTESAKWGKAVYCNDGEHKIEVPGATAAGEIYDDGFDDRILLEAYARFLQNIYSRDDAPAPGDTPAPGDRHFTTARADRGYGVRLDLRQAWSEGWAHFFSSLVMDDSRAGFLGNNAVTVRFDIDGPEVYNPPSAGKSGPDNEFAAASMLWQFYKADRPANGPKIWTVFTQMQQPATPATLEEFYRVWASPPNSFVVSPELNAAASARGITYYADSPPASREAPMPIAPGGQAVQRTFYPAGNVDYFSFTAIQGEEFEIKTFALSSGADTLLSIMDEAGFVLTQEVAGQPKRTWDSLAGDPVSSITFKAPYEGTNTYQVACSHSTAALPAVDNAPSDDITAGCPARLGAYSLTIVSTSQGITVTRVEPSNAATDVAVNVGLGDDPDPAKPKVLIVFNGAVDSATVTSTTFTVKDSAGDVAAGSVVQIGDANRYFAYVFDANLRNSTVYTIEVTADVKDPLGNAAAQFTSTFRTVGPFVDVTSVTPADGATDVAVDTTVTLGFLEAVDKDSAIAGIKLFNGQPKVAGTVTQDPDDPLKFTFDPNDRLLTKVTYTVRVADVQNEAQTNTMGTAFESSFTTTGFAVLSWSPEDGATDVPVTLPATGISIIFNSAIDVSTAYDAASMISSTVIVTRDTDVPVGSWVQAIDPRTLLVRPAAYLRGEVTYTVTVKSGEAGVKSASGDTLAADATISFTTATRPAQQLGESVARVTKAKAYSGSGFIDIAWTNPFGDWPGLLIAASRDVFPSLFIGSDSNGSPAIQVKNGSIVYQGEPTKTSYRIKADSGGPLRVNIWVVNGLDYSRAVSLESRPVSGARGMPGKTDEPADNNNNNNNNNQQGLTAVPKSALNPFGPQDDDTGAGGTDSGTTTDPGGDEPDTVVTQPEQPSAEPVSLADPVIGNVRGPMRARAASGDGFIDINWTIPGDVEGIVVAMGSGEFPSLKVARDADGNESFRVVGGSKIYEGSDSKKLRVPTPNGGIRQFTLWTFSGGKVSRPISLESRATSGARGM